MATASTMNTADVDCMPLEDNPLPLKGNLYELIAAALTSLISLRGVRLNTFLTKKTPGLNHL